MINKIFRVIIGIIIICVVVFGIYMILPGQYKGPLRQVFQEAVDKDAKALADEYRNAQVPKHKGITFDQMMVAASANPSWYVKTISEEPDKVTGEYEVQVDGYKVTLEMPHENGQSNSVVYVNSHVRIVFHASRAADGKLTTSSWQVFIDDTEQDDFYKQAVCDDMCDSVK